jgi:murein DD-endopeptidase MepM/ murein hydrolase activator NlpD
MVACGGGSAETKSNGASGAVQNVETEYLYGIDITGYTITNDTVRSGETVGGILGRRGVSPVMVDRLDKVAADVFPLRKIRADKAYTTFMRTECDSLGQREVLDYLVYHIDAIEYVTFGFHSDSVSVTKGQNPVDVVRQRREAVINSSLWGAIMEQNMPYALAAEVEDIYQWTVDFFGIQPGDEFKVVYENRYIKDECIGMGKILATYLNNAGEEHYAYYFEQNGKGEYFDKEGANLRKAFLKAPLNYRRISSTFTNARRHPVTKVVRPHHGVDYAAPTGTPVVTIGDGTVIEKGWDKKGGGNYLKIKHNSTYTTTYMHLNGFAKGIQKGSKVKQGQLIGYVGSTGMSTGPHLDFRLNKNGTYIDPLKFQSPSADPVSDANKAAFEAVVNKYEL